MWHLRYHLMWGTEGQQCLEIDGSSSWQEYTCGFWDKFLTHPPVPLRLNMDQIKIRAC